MQRTMTILFTGALLAVSASLAPNAAACGLPGVNPGAPSFKTPAGLPPGLAAMPNESSPAGVSASSAVPIVGLWNVTFYSEGAVTDQAFDAWHSDGTEILNDFTDPIEDNVCLGVWAQTGAQSFKLKHPSWTFDINGNLTGTAYILEAVTVSSSGNEYAGPYSISFFDTNGNPTGNFTGVIKANRITP